MLQYQSSGGAVFVWRQSTFETPTVGTLGRRNSFRLITGSGRGQVFGRAQFFGAAPLTGTGAVTEAGDTASAAGVLTHLGSGAVTEAGDSATGAGVRTHLGSGAVTEARDSPAGVGAVAHLGTGAVTEAGDTASGIGSVAGTGVAGTGAVTEARDTAAGAGLITHLGSGAVTEAGDTAAGAGTGPTLGAVATPDTDIVPGAWVASTPPNLYAMLDEASPDNNDYIRATSATTCEIGLSAVADPNTSTGQAFSYTAWSPEGNGLVVRLKQGVTTIATWTHAAGALPATPTTYTQNLTGPQCDAITDYTALSVEFEATV